MIACYAPDATFSDPAFPRLDAAGRRGDVADALRARQGSLASSRRTSRPTRPRAARIGSRRTRTRRRAAASRTSIDATFAFRDGLIVAPRRPLRPLALAAPGAGTQGCAARLAAAGATRDARAGGESARRVAARGTRPDDRRAVSCRSRRSARPAGADRRPAVNLGTPDAPTPSAVRRYLAEFLSDRARRRDSALVWTPILHGVVLRTRPARSAKKYAMIWSSEGSPLLVHSVKQRTLVMGYLGQRMKDRGLPADFAAGRARRCATAIPASPRRWPSSRRRAATAFSSCRFFRSTRPARRRRRWTPSMRTRSACDGCPACATIDCFHDDPGLHQGARAQRQRLLGEARPPRPVRA